MGYRIVGEVRFKSKGYKPKDPFGARIMMKAINTNITASDVKRFKKREGDDNAKILEKEIRSLVWHKMVSKQLSNLNLKFIPMLI